MQREFRAEDLVLGKYHKQQSDRNPKAGHSLGIGESQ
jgi:hypothetical protein